MAEAAPLAGRVDGVRRRTLETPEGVDLQLTLADGNQRLGAFLIDLMVMVAVLLLLTIVALVVAASQVSAAGFQLAAIIWMLGFFLLRNFYFILLELGPRGATVGKRALGLRVVARSGDRLTADRVIARNMMREVEFYLPVTFLMYNIAQGTASPLAALAGLAWTGIFLFFPLTNRDRLRVGDLLAGTWVVNAPRMRLGSDVLARPTEQARGIAFSDAQLDVYGVFELQTLERVLRDNDATTIGAVAATIRNKIGLPDDGADRLFLRSYYDAVRARMERGLLFGRRRADKFDIAASTRGGAEIPR